MNRGMAVRSRRFLAFGAVLFTALGVSLLSVMYARADVPLAARLLSEPYTTTGVRVNVANLGSQMRGLANDGNTVYAMNQSGDIVTVDLASISMAEGQAQQDVVGAQHTVGWGQNGAPSLPGSIDTLSLVYSRGCLFMTDNSNVEGSIRLYCIDVSDWSVTEVSVPAAYPLPAGYYYVTSSLIDFPDGRIGKVSAYTQTGPAMHESTLRTYTVSGQGKNVSLAFAEDYVMQDDSTIYTDANGWARDEHGIATDGTYLYRIQWNSITPNTKVWELQSGQPSQVVYEGSYTQPFSNMHYLSHNHKDNYYLMGHFWGTEFFITKSADPGPGPGNPLTPTFAAHSPLRRSFTVQITNYDPSFNWSVSSSAGTATISSSGLVTVTGLNPGQAATITVGTQKTGIPNGSAPSTGVALTKDINDDGIDDSTQPEVWSLTNELTGKTVGISVESGGNSCEVTEAVAHSVDAIGVDAGYTYPLGLLGFEAVCGTPGFTATIHHYYYNPSATDVYAARKYKQGAYTNIPGASLQMKEIDGTQVLVVSYTVVDGGELDDDGVANGAIVDPAGPAVASAPSAPNTGFTPRSAFSAAYISWTAPLVASAIIVIIVAGVLMLERRR